MSNPQWYLNFGEADNGSGQTIQFAINVGEGYVEALRGDDAEPCVRNWLHVLASVAHWVAETNPDPSLDLTFIEVE